MGTDLLTLLQRWELLAFFAGYPLLYTLVSFVAGHRPGISGAGRLKLPAALPAGYAMAGTLFLLFLVWRANRPVNESITLLRIWAVLAALFWLPPLRRSPLLSLLHSLVFFGLVVQDLISGFSSLSGRDGIRNDMTIFSLSFLLNTTLFALVSLVLFIRRRGRAFNG